MDRVTGSMEVLSSMQLTKDMAGLDAQSRALLHNREVLAVILGEVVAEYRGYSRKEIMDFIEAGPVTDGKEVSSGRTNTRVSGDCAEYVQLNEKTSHFDLVFRAKNPVLSREGMLVSLHMNLESQKTYRPGYPIEKRGMYYLARSLSSQLSLVTDETDYSGLEKCYSIWICRDDIPRGARNSVAVYEVTNTKDTGSCGAAKEFYDLMTLVIIKLGQRVYNGNREDVDYELLRFLNTIMYPHEKDFLDKVSEYIDFSSNEELWKEAGEVSGLGECVYRDGLEDGLEQGLEKGIRAMIEDNMEEAVPEARILEKLQKHFKLTDAEAEQYYRRFALEE
ncbi:MAG: hypothetical protein K1W28_06900 [Lachnospiraceae bacterium]